MIESTRVQQHDQDHADEGAEIAAAAAEDVGAADDHRGDRRQQVGVAHALVGLGRIAGEQHAGEAGADAAEHEGSEDHARWC